MKKTRTRKVVPDKEYFEVLNQFLDAIFDRMAEREDISWFDLCKEVNISVSTFYRLMHRMTERPQFYTLFKLARGAGLSFRLIERFEKRLKVKRVA